MKTRLYKNRIRIGIGIDAQNVGKTQEVTKLKQKTFCLKGGKVGEVGMIGVWMTPCKNGQCELSVRRDGINKIVISTQTLLTDTQVEELFWCVGAMQRSGKTLKNLLKEQEPVVRCFDCKYFQWGDPDNETIYCGLHGKCYRQDFFCADGERRKQ